jgi:hypothetical protein
VSDPEVTTTAINPPATATPVTPEVAAYPAAPTVSAPSWTTRFEAALLRRALTVGVLCILIMIGLFLTNVSHERARFYWSAMFPIFGVFCIWNELTSPDHGAQPLWKILLVQTLHWIGPIVAVRIIFLQLSRGQMDADADALMTLLILSVTSFLAGVHLNRSFYWVSAVLAIAAIIGTEVEAYLWLLTAIAALAVAVTAFSVYALRREPGGARA